MSLQVFTAPKISFEPKHIYPRSPSPTNQRPYKKLLGVIEDESTESGNGINYAGGAETDKRRDRYPENNAFAEVESAESNGAAGAAEDGRQEPCVCEESA